MKKILDIGCGSKKYNGAVGIDFNAEVCPDIVHDLNVFPYPIEDNSFEEVIVDNCLEHLENPIKVMDEIFRISQSGAKIKIYLPYFRSHWASVDPTHLHFFTVNSFQYFNPDSVYNKKYKYTKSIFKIEKIAFNERLKTRGLFRLLAKTLANVNPIRYEHYLSHLIPLDELTFELRNLK